MRFDRLYLRSVVRSIEERINLTELDLAGFSVLTEAATGAYAITPVVAAMAGAREVVAYTKKSRFGNIEDVMHETDKLIDAVGRQLPVNIIHKISAAEYSRFDIITNSGHLRPINKEHIMSMKPNAVIPLMYESWELRESDIDLSACRERGIRVAGTNEHHPLLNVFEYLGPLVVRALHNSYIPVVGSRIAVFSNNLFGLQVARHLVRNQAEVFCIGPEDSFSGLDGAVLCGDLPSAEIVPKLDVCVVATTPLVSSERTYDGNTVTDYIAKICPGTCVHLWGDINYDPLLRSDIVMIPPVPVAIGHQGLVMSGVGPEPVIRLIVGGFKVAEVLAKRSFGDLDLEFCQLNIRKNEDKP